jgi:RimJ/RimL family protein N-acetyltransferase
MVLVAASIDDSFFKQLSFFLPAGFAWRMGFESDNHRKGRKIHDPVLSWRRREKWNKIDGWDRHKMNAAPHFGLCARQKIAQRCPVIRKRKSGAEMIKLIPFTEKEFEDYRRQGIARYAEENVKAGFWNPAEAIEKSRAAHEALLPQGLATPHQHLFSIREMENGEQVGTIWLSEDTESGIPSGFIYDLFIFEPFRRRGYATRAMRALEDKAKGLGLTVMYLHVFAHNPAARSLYDKLGYGVKSTNMAKPLTSGKEK